MEDFDAVMKLIGFKVDRPMCGSRGMYFITSYIPRVAYAREGFTGRLEFHTDMETHGKTHYEFRGQVRVADSHPIKFEMTGDDYNEFVEKVKAELRKTGLL